VSRGRRKPSQRMVHTVSSTKLSARGGQKDAVVLTSISANYEHEEVGLRARQKELARGIRVESDRLRRRVIHGSSTLETNYPLRVHHPVVGTQSVILSGIPGWSV